MQKYAIALVAILALAAVAVPARAGDAESVTLEGKILCAKCTLHEEGREDCQNVLAVGSGDETTYYYIKANEASDAFGMVCEQAKAVRITGNVTEAEGKMWIEAAEIVPTEEQG
jgi:hypothetical protein